MSEERIDLTEWHGSLVETLIALDTLFRDEAGTAHDRQRIALAALAKTVVAVSELPGLKDRIAPLFALLFAYQALTDTGKTDPLLVNHVKTKGGRQMAMAGAVVQGRSAAFVELMILSGWSEREAVEFVTSRLVKAGVKGKRGGPLTVSSLRTWRTNARSGDYPEVTKHLQAGVTNLQAMFRETTGRWPPSKEEIAVIVGGVPDIQMFRDFASSASSSMMVE